MLRVDGNMVSITLLIQNPGLERARNSGYGRWCTNPDPHRPDNCNFLHRKERHSGGFRVNECALDTLLTLVEAPDPSQVVLGSEEQMMGFKELLRTSSVVRRLLPVVCKIVHSFSGEGDLSPAKVEVRLCCDVWVIRCTEKMEDLRKWTAGEQEQIFELTYDLYKRDPTSYDGRRALSEASVLPLVPEDRRREATLLLQELEAHIKEAEADKEGKQVKKRYTVCQMYKNDMMPISAITVLPHTAVGLREGYERLEELPGVVVDRFIPRELGGLHLRALFHLSRADCMHSLSETVELLQEKGGSFLSCREAKKSGMKIEAYSVLFSGIQPSPYDGVLFIFRLPPRRVTHKARFLSGDLVVLWSGSGEPAARNFIVGVVKRIKDDVEVAVSPVDILKCLPCVKAVASFAMIRCPTFYLPTASSLCALQMHEKRFADGVEPALLRAVITGEGATNAPIYLQDNPSLQIGLYVTLGPDVDDMQPALGEWRSENWTEELERKTHLDSKGKKALLDGTQLAALKHIFRNQVAVVQGTPGTGKSFVCAKFLQLLLENKQRLGIGPIVVMTYTHHALESTIGNLKSLLGDNSDTIGILGHAIDEELKEYEVRLPRSRRTMGEEFYTLVSQISSLKETNVVTETVEDTIMVVLQKYRESALLTKWLKQQTHRRHTMQTLKLECDSIQKDISAKLLLNMPKNVIFLENQLSALQLGMWFGVVDVIPYLGSECGINKENFLAQVRAIKKDVTDAHGNVCVTPEVCVYLQEELGYLADSFVGRAKQGLLRRSLPLFEAAIERLLAALKRIQEAESKTFLEEWRNEKCDFSPLPEVGENVMHNAADYHNSGGPKEDSALNNFEASALEERRRERDVDEDENFDEAQVPKISLLALPLAEERKRYVHDASERLANVGPGIERSVLLNVLRLECIYSLQERLSYIVEEMEKEHLKLQLVDGKKQSSCLVEYGVIAATSTKMMEVIETVQKCGASVLVVEEAAELLESHILACITESMQHIVLIGDHKQLRPKVSEYILERRHNLAVSAMERLVLSGLPCVTLTMQRRMTSEISCLTKPYYLRSCVAGDCPVVIEDHPRTSNIPPPFGVCRATGSPHRLYFIDHDGSGEKKEWICGDMMSPQNSFEAKFVSCIAHYLWNINPAMSITILVPYNGQQFVVFKELERMGVPCRGKHQRNKAGVRLSTIDDYQGEEDDIIILSLVRTEKPGFLRLENRSCVALSRARSALYVVGCSSLMSDACDLWKHLKETCLRDGCFGTHFPARCDSHPTHDLSFGSIKEYEMKRASCPERCDAVLECGHRCEAKCHAHRAHPKCVKPCERTGNVCNPPRPWCQHPCVNLCGNNCGVCTVRVGHKYEECGHTVMMQCHMLGDVPLCRELCTKEALCGHEVSAPCMDHANGTAVRNCGERCSLHMSCGHVCRTKCHFGIDDDHGQRIQTCVQERISQAPCGHNVKHRCNQKDLTGLCNAVCGREVFACRHRRRCALQCGHTGSCNCKEIITVKLPCGHDSEEHDCCAPDPPLCTSPCEATLLCGHRCKGKCGVCSLRKFHSGCQEKGKALVCGHASKVGCTAVVDLCEEPCSFWCGHGKPCGEVCEKAVHTCSSGCPAKKCMEPCAWSCPHGACVKKCNEPCEFGGDKDGCWRRCSEKLPCGHQCCGLCGETCPTFCWDCYVEGVPNTVSLAQKVHTFIGDSDEVRLGKPVADDGEPPFLVELPCCGSFLPARELLSTFAAKKSEEVGVHTCPLCRVVLQPMSFRHGGYFIKQQLLAAEKVAARIDEELQKLKKSAECCVDEILEYLAETNVHTGCLEQLRGIIQQTRERLKKQNKFGKGKPKSGIKLPQTDIPGAFARHCGEIFLEKKWISLLLYHLQVLEVGLVKLRKSDSNIARNAEMLSRAAFSFVKMHDERVGKGTGASEMAERVRAFCSRNLAELVDDPGNLTKSLPSAQNNEEVKKFAQRVEWTSYLHKLAQLPVEVPKALSEHIETAMWFAAHGIAPEEEDRAKQVVLCFSQRKLIAETVRYAAKSLGLSAGHWFQCPNGHIYAIGDCGGAMEEGWCPECGAKVGGRQHRLRSDNAFAGHFVDPGATPSWPTALGR
ncbi:hypothetical protein DQ04_00011020 [Trypanosoma grayi]|uniref:hypothetical protein n=1 Tax=Trypanosoma grayi TaxID=71804 RepID=UPI0004F49A38|nr:hypothetical protein DQ04_00011020 [Trypanosoma grayi]KEG15635.1 hypothetical protein DQ04_00011020 [Trypanosoma grayi]